MVRLLVSTARRLDLARGRLFPLGAGTALSSMPYEPFCSRFLCRWRRGCRLSSAITCLVGNCWAVSFPNPSTRLARPREACASPASTRRFAVLVACCGQVVAVYGVKASLACRVALSCLPESMITFPRTDLLLPRICLAWAHHSRIMLCIPSRLATSEAPALQ